MFEKQTQEVGNNSSAVQVNGDFIVTPYTELKAIFLDLFELNFPKIQEVAAKKAQERIDELLEQLKISLEKHKTSIDSDKFTEPAIQYEMQGIAIDVARRGEKSNIEMLCELLCTISSKDCPELVELIAGESRRVLPMLSNKHLSYLSLEILVNEASYQNPTELSINQNLLDLNTHIESAINLTNGDLQYLNCIGCIASKGIRVVGIVPNFIKEVNSLKDKKLEELSAYCAANNLKNINTFLDIMNKCQIGVFNLTATGRL